MGKSVLDCFNSGNIHGAIVGGIRGRGYDTDTHNCHNTGNVETTRSDGLKYCGEIVGDYYDSGNKYTDCTYLNKTTNANTNGATGKNDMTETMSMSNFVDLLNSYVTTNNEDSSKEKLKTWILEDGNPVFDKQ